MTETYTIKNNKSTSDKLQPVKCDYSHLRCDTKTSFSIKEFESDLEKLFSEDSDGEERCDYT